jgi:hypothetical protein
MGGMSEDALAMRDKFEQALLAEVARVGLEHFTPDAVIKRFLGCGGKRTSLYRWQRELMATDRPREHLDRVTAQAVAIRAAVDPEPAAGAAGAAADGAKAVIIAQHVVRGTGGAGAMALLEKLHDCIKTAEDVLAHAKTPEGKVRNSKLMLQAAENLRRSIETGSKIAEMLVRADKIEQFNRAVIEEIAKVSPELAEQVALRLSQLASSWAR